MKFFGHQIYDTTLVFILASTVCSLFLYNGEIDRTESLIILGVSALVSGAYFFKEYYNPKK